MRGISGHSNDSRAEQAEEQESDRKWRKRRWYQTKRDATRWMRLKSPNACRLLRRSLCGHRNLKSVEWIFKARFVCHHQLSSLNWQTAFWCTKKQVGHLL